MSDNKKYYYLRLKDNFFESDEMIILESMPDGYVYSNILLKLYLRSLKNEGKLMFSDRIPFNSTMLATLTRHPVGVVEKSINIFSELGLIEVLDNGAIYMLDIQTFIGKTSTEGDRKKEYRDKIKAEKQGILIDRQKSGQMSDNRTPEIEIEKEQERNKEKEKEYIVGQDFIFPNYLSEKALEEIKKGNPENYEKRIPIAYLNQVTDSKYKFVEKNMKLVNARFNDGYTLNDFKIVIDKKVAEWSKSDMSKYLRPTTLFGTRFDEYLNQKTNDARLEHTGSSEYDNLGW